MPPPSNTLLRKIAHLHGLRWPVHGKDGEKLRSFTTKECQEELATHQGILPDGWARNEHGIYRKIETDPDKYLLLVLNGNPGWSWYYSHDPDTSYEERGGGCLAWSLIRELETCVACGQPLNAHTGSHSCNRFVFLD